MESDMDLSNSEVLKDLVAKTVSKSSQLIQVWVETANIYLNGVDVKWYNIQSNGAVNELFASATIRSGDADGWFSCCFPTSRIIEDGIQDLERLAQEVSTALTPR